MVKTDYCYFWRKESPFSQWYPCKFSVDGTEYNCAEQYYMQQKALIFNDTSMAAAIMAERNPARQKALGRSVRNFDPVDWEKKAYDIVMRGNRAKFSQNQHLKTALLAQKGKKFVEASPYDTIWGIGYSYNNPNAWDESTWRGKNLLGKAITQVRDEMETL